ncbi:MAG: methionine--tRNA ligase [Candidatus Pacebacteria bacterium]|jgi:methionyl-tRNA synthetase|nr:methionine--tRNA ligase [Candidatus Paceibacterota bacterium]
MEEKKFYITTPIFYANAELHLGHTYSLVLSDVLARYHRFVGDRTFFLTGSDEHGDKIVRAAQKENLGPQAFVNKNVEKAQELLKELGISNDMFIRTSDQEQHWPGATKLWYALERAGDVYKGTYKGLYCVGCEAFITEKELVEGKCPLHDAAPEQIEEENYFFKLSKYAPEIKRLLESGEFKITPRSKANEIISLIASSTAENELGDVSISRPERAIPWGIPVPNDPGQLMYVWCDALSNYLSAIGYGSSNETGFKSLWPADVQVLGKDILRFHALLWPAFLLSAKLPLPKELLVHGFVNSGGKKMSKSLGNVLMPRDFIAEYGRDALRYYLTREVSPVEDWDLTREKFKEVYNANLANGLGNLISRTLKMSEAYFGGVVEGDASRVPALRTKITAFENAGDVSGLNLPYLITNDILPRYHKHMSASEINKGADVVWELIGHLDQFVTDYEPFKLVKTDKDAAKDVIWGLLYGLREIGQMLTPIMPDTAARIAILVGASDIDGGKITFNSKAPVEPLFKRKE